MGEDVLKAPLPDAPDWASAPAPVGRPGSGSVEIDRTHRRIAGRSPYSRQGARFRPHQMHGQLRMTRKPEVTEGEPMAEKETAIRAVAQLADHVHWVREWPDKPTWRDRLHRWVCPESYHFDRAAIPPKPWVDRPAGHYEREGRRIRAAYFRSDLAFEVEYVVCDSSCAACWKTPLALWPSHSVTGVPSSRENSSRRPGQRYWWSLRSPLKCSGSAW